jgi:hypothetical protein
MIYEINKIEGEFPHKFVVTREKDALLYSASTYLVSPEGKHLIFHKDIAKKFGLNLESILGGGYATQNKERPQMLEVGKASKEFGSVPQEILERFDLIREYQSIYPNLFDEISIVPDTSQIKLPNWEELLKYGGNRQ